MLYFYTRATTVGISLPALFSTSISLLIAFPLFPQLVPPGSSAQCDEIEYLEGFDIFLLPWYILVLQQFWLLSRLKVVRTGRRFGPLLSWLPTVVRVLPDHSERQSSRDDEEFSTHYRLAVSVRVDVTC